MKGSIYTRRGDGGETDLFGGERVSKDAERIEAVGAVDELNAAVGIGAAGTSHSDVRELLEGIQNDLFDLGACLATPDSARRRKQRMRELSDREIEALESRIDAFDVELEPLSRFILPGGTPCAANLHLARTVCRRAERRVVALARSEELEHGGLRYLNRLSDLLFVLARLENRRAGVADVPWQRSD